MLKILVEGVVVGSRRVPLKSSYACYHIVMYSKSTSQFHYA